MQRAELVAIGVAQIGQVQLAHSAIAPARRVFTGAAAVGNTCRMPGVNLLGRFGLEADRAAIAMASRLAIDGRGDAEAARLAAVEVAVLVGHARGNAQGGKQRVVKLVGGFEVVDADHDVAEHSFCLRGVPGMGVWDRGMAMDGWLTSFTLLRAV